MGLLTSLIFGSKKKANQRHDPRHPVLLDVRLNSASVSNAKGRITDLSTKGCYIVMQMGVEKGEKMQVHIPLPTGKIFTVNGFVVFCDPHVGFGVEFDLTRNQKEFMQDFIEYASHVD